MKREPITNERLSGLADGLLRHLEKPVRGDAPLAIAALAVAMRALARADKLTLAELHHCLDIAHAEINPKLDS